MDGTACAAGVGDRVVAQLLSEMDGLQQRLGVVVSAGAGGWECKL